MKLASTLALSALLLIGAPALADNPTTVSRIAEKTPHACMQKMPKLSDAQKQQLTALRDKYELDTAQKKAELHVTFRQLHQVLRADNVDKTKAEALQAKINGLRDDLSNARLNLRLAASDVFTPEQKAAFREMRRFHHGHFNRGGEKGQRQSVG
jgi:Spy/CpxP family protein refolding chaperone